MLRAAVGSRTRSLGVRAVLPSDRQRRQPKTEVSIPSAEAPHRFRFKGGSCAPRGCAHAHRAPARALAHARFIFLGGSQRSRSQTRFRVRTDFGIGPEPRSVWLPWRMTTVSSRCAFAPHRFSKPADHHGRRHPIEEGGGPAPQTLSRPTRLPTEVAPRAIHLPTFNRVARGVRLPRTPHAGCVSCSSCPRLFRRRGHVNPRAVERRPLTFGSPGGSRTRTVLVKKSFGKTRFPPRRFRRRSRCIRNPDFTPPRAALHEHRPRKLDRSRFEAPRSSRCRLASFFRCPSFWATGE